MRLFRLGRLQLRRTFERPLRSALLVVSVGAATALLVASAAIYGSMTGSLDRIFEFASEADLEIVATSDAGFPEEVMLALERSPEIEAVAPVVRAKVLVEGEEALLLGLDARAEEFGGPLAAEMRTRFARFADDPALLLHGVFVAEELASRSRIEEGEPLHLWAGGKRRSTTVLGIIPGFAGTEINGGRLVVALRGVAQDLLGKPGRIHNLYLKGERGIRASDLEALASSHSGEGTVVSAPGVRAEQAASDLAPLRLSMILIVSIVFVIAGFLISNTARATAFERRIEIATMRALGGRRRDLLGSALIELAILASAGAILGSAAGLVLGRFFLGRVPGLALTAVGVEVGFEVDPAVAVLGATAGALIAIAAASGPLLTAVSARPVEAMRNDPIASFETGGGASRLSAVFGIALFLAGTALVVVRPGATWALATAGALIPGGILFFTRGLASPFAALQARVAGGAGADGRLAEASLGRAPRRVWGTTMAVAMSVSVVVATAGIARNADAAFGRINAAYRQMDLIVQTSPPHSPPTDHSLHPEVAPRLESVPGVASVVPSRHTFATMGGDRIYVVGLDPRSHHPILELAPASARAEMFDGAVIVSRDFAARRNLEPGDRFAIPTPAGDERVRVAAIVDVVLGLDGGAIGIPLRRSSEWFGAGGVSRFEVEVERGADQFEVRRSIERLGSLLPHPWFVFTGEEQAAALHSAISALVAFFTGVEAVGAGAAALVIFGSMTTSVLQRTRELGVLRALGASRRRLRRMVLWEALVIAGAGAVVGIALGIFIHGIGVSVMGSYVGMAIPYRVVPSGILLGILVAFVPAIIGGIGPAARAGDISVVRALAYE